MRRDDEGRKEGRKEYVDEGNKRQVEDVKCIVCCCFVDVGARGSQGTD